MVAIAMRQIDSIKILLEAGADINLIFTSQGIKHTPLGWALNIIRNTEVAEFLMQRGANLE